MLNFSIANCRRVLDKPKPGARISVKFNIRKKSAQYI